MHGTPWYDAGGAAWNASSSLLTDDRDGSRSFACLPISTCDEATHAQVNKWRYHQEEDWYLGQEGQNEMELKVKDNSVVLRGLSLSVIETRSSNYRAVFCQ